MEYRGQVCKNTIDVSPAMSLNRQDDKETEKAGATRIEVEEQVDSPESANPENIPWAENRWWSQRRGATQTRRLSRP